jgi:hypothetical protein
MSEECAICGLDVDDKFSYKLSCNHVFHYECIMKTFQNSPKKYKKQFNHCPYCRLKTGYLPLINGLKKIIPGVHCDFSSKSINDKKNTLKTEHSVKCQHILTRGKNKGNLCNKNCSLGYNTCKAHLNKDKNLICKIVDHNKQEVKQDINGS